ncbi:MAG: transcriptional repressor [Desulfovibrionaceae bacterium]|jgi:Fur family ferric uptake transcriptional regulator|nr:transcriptional repressor [Desulfovibrionaceae bacterium]
MKDPQTIFHEYLVRNKLKMTPQRRLILEVFLASGEHLASEELYRQVRDRDPSIGQATVYRTLKLLHDAGIAGSYHFGDGVVRYEPRYGQQHHDHLICERCGKNIEVVDEKIERLQEELAKRHGFVLTGHRMYLYGLCSECRTA